MLSRQKRMHVSVPICSKALLTQEIKMNMIRSCVVHSRSIFVHRIFVMQCVWLFDLMILLSSNRPSQHAKTGLGREGRKGHEPMQTEGLVKKDKGPRGFVLNTLHSTTHIAVFYTHLWRKVLLASLLATSSNGLQLRLLEEFFICKGWNHVFFVTRSHPQFWQITKRSHRGRPARFSLSRAPDQSSCSA